MQIERVFTTVRPPGGSKASEERVTNEQEEERSCQCGGAARPCWSVWIFKACIFTFELCFVMCL